MSTANDRQTAEHGAAIFPYAAEAAGDEDAGYTPEWEDGRDAQAVTLAEHAGGDAYDAAIEEDDERTYLQMCAEQGREPVATMTVGPAPEPAARLGFTDASRTVAAQYAAGVGLDQIAAHHDDVSASLAADAQTPLGRSCAREYADTARSLIADLRADANAARTEPPAPGTPHPDARLAARGWQTDRSGIYVRVPPEQQLEAG